MDFEEKVEFITCSRVNGLPEDCKPEKCATCTFKLPNIDGVASEIARLKVESAPGIREEIWKAACCTENIDNPCLPDKECKECTICRVLEAVQPLIEQAKAEARRELIEELKAEFGKYSWSPYDPVKILEKEKL